MCVNVCLTICIFLNQFAISSVLNDNSDNDDDHDDCVKLNEPRKRHKKVRKRKHCADGMHK